MIDKILSLLSPFECIGCGEEGRELCLLCADDKLEKVPPMCYRCGKSSYDSSTCKSCRSSTAIKHFWAATYYEDLAKRLLHRVKFEYAKSACIDVANIISETLPDTSQIDVITYVPTTNSRVRSRGFDQSRLIAREIAKLKLIEFRQLLLRVGRTRQVGSGRKERFEQMKLAFTVSNLKDVAGKRILLIDDVLTTGATVESAAKLLKDGGAKSVDVAVFARTTFKN